MCSKKTIKTQSQNQNIKINFEVNRQKLQNKMYRPQFHYFHNPKFNQWSPHFKPREPFLRRNYTTNRFRPAGPSILQSDYKFWCETCDKGFQTLQILDNHKSQHQKCNIDGCQFVAHPKVITKHIQMQHSTGLYKKIANLNNPEDIQKWREERKRKYPTKENIERKAAEVKEKLERGEKLGIKYPQNNKRHNPGQLTDVKQKFMKGKTQKRHGSFRLRCENNLTPPASKKICRTKPIKKEIYKLQSFTGIHQIIIDDDKNQEEHESQDSLIEDDIFCEELTMNTNISTQLEPTLCGALSTLICNYGSSDEDDISENPNLNDKKHDKIINSLSGNKIKEEEKIIVKNEEPICMNSNNDKSDDDSGPEEIITKKDEPENDILNNTCKKVKTITNVKNHNPNVRHSRKPKHQLPSTLLVKLLNREIKQERNIILQCVNYVVKNNFFDCNENKD